METVAFLISKQTVDVSRCCGFADAVFWIWISTGFLFQLSDLWSTGFQDVQSEITVALTHLVNDGIFRQDRFNQVYAMTECGL